MAAPLMTPAANQSIHSAGGRTVSTAASGLLGANDWSVGAVCNGRAACVGRYAAVYATIFPSPTSASTATLMPSGMPERARSSADQPDLGVYHSTHDTDAPSIDG